MIDFLGESNQLELLSLDLEILPRDESFVLLSDFREKMLSPDPTESELSVPLLIKLPFFFTVSGAVIFLSTSVACL
ncbi:hypothetical protein D3C74_375650 [compost metagenome]